MKRLMFQFVTKQNKKISSLLFFSASQPGIRSIVSNKCDTGKQTYKKISVIQRQLTGGFISDQSICSLLCVTFEKVFQNFILTHTPLVMKNVLSLISGLTRRVCGEKALKEGNGKGMAFHYIR